MSMNMTGLTPQMIMVLLKRDFQLLYFVVLYNLFLLLFWHSAPMIIVFIMIAVLLGGIADRFSSRSHYSYPFLLPNYLKAEYLTFSIEFGLILVAVALRWIVLDPHYTMPAIAMCLIVAAITSHSIKLKVRLPKIRVAVLLPVILLCLIAVISFVYFSALSLADLLAGAFFLPIIYIWDSVLKFWLLLQESYTLQIVILLLSLSAYILSQRILIRSFNRHSAYKPEKDHSIFNGHYRLYNQQKYVIDAPQGRLLHTQIVTNIQNWLFGYTLRNAKTNTTTTIKRWLNYLLFSRFNAQLLLFDTIFLTSIIVACVIIAKAEPSAPTVGIGVVVLLSYSYFRNLLLSGQLLALREQLALLNLMNSEMDRRGCHSTVGYLFVINLIIPAVAFYCFSLFLAKKGMENGESLYPFISAILVVNIFSIATGLLFARIAQPSSLLQRSLYIVLHFIFAIIYLFVAVIYNIPQVPIVIAALLLVVSLNQWWAGGIYEYS